MDESAKSASLAAALPALLLGISLLLGGGGSPAPLLELTLQLFGAVIFGWWLLQYPPALRAVAPAVWWIAALVSGLHLLQLILLPPALWQALPGREGERAALELVGAADSWRALSLSPARTLASLLAALSALALLIMTAALAAQARWRLLMVTAASGLATLVVGAAQLSGGTGNPFRFFDPNTIWLTGFQANHNSTADLILIAMLGMAALAKFGLDRGLVRPGILLAACTVLVADGAMVLGLFLTGSRAGLGLLPLILALQYLILQPDARIRWGRLGASAAGAAAVGGLAFILLRDNRAIQAILARFTLEGEFRPELWRDSFYALGQYWPVGSGQGTFTPVMMAVERLEVVDPTLPNRAHNDYLELAIGAGFPGLAVAVAVGAIIAVAAIRRLRSPGSNARPQTLFALGTLSVMALHSLVDYPMRSMALAALAAFATGLLFQPQQAGSGQSGESQS